MPDVLSTALNDQDIETAEQVRETYDILMKSAPLMKVVVRGNEETVDRSERIAFMEAAMLAATKIVIGK